jgi:hypothetical protein
MIGSSLLMASFGFMVYSVTPAMADSNNQKLNVNSNYKMVPTNADGFINVKLSDEQLDKIIPKNGDGSINVKLSDEQLDKIFSKNPNGIVDVNLVGIRGTEISYTSSETGRAMLNVRSR